MTDTPNILHLGTRGSALARWQADHIQALLRQAQPDIKIEITIFSTRGDKELDKPLPEIGGKGLFTAELEAALRGGSIDCAVHSLKDMPTDDPEGLTIGAIPERANPADVLVSRSGYTLDTLPQGAQVGTSSRRRAAQLLAYRSDLQILDIRGNVDTRVDKALDPDGPYDAIILAHAGLARLGRLDVVTQVIPLEMMLPAAGQGAIAVQCRNQPEARRLFRSINHTPTQIAVTAERTFLAGLGGGCSLPIAAYGLVEGPQMSFKGRVLSVDGGQQIEMSGSAPIEINGIRAVKQLASGLAHNAIGQGAAELLKGLE